MKLELANHSDQILAEAVVKTTEEVRRTEVEGLADTVAARLVLPKLVADLLGVPKVGGRE